MRALTAMKQNGVNVVSDVLNTVNLSGTKGGIVLVVADDPGGHSSTNEMDSRLHAKLRGAAPAGAEQPGRSQGNGEIRV